MGDFQSFDVMTTTKSGDFPVPYKLKPAGDGHVKSSTEIDGLKFEEEVDHKLLVTSLIVAQTTVLEQTAPRGSDPTISSRFEPLHF